VQNAIDSLDEHPAQPLTGLCDSSGQAIRVGDLIKKPVDCNEEFHGSWAIYEVRLQGITPLIVYIRSEKGILLPEGYLAAPLADEYDQKMFCFAKDSTKLNPIDDIKVISREEFDSLSGQNKD
jgi:hypothetical protein